MVTYRIGLFIKRERLRKGISQEDLCDDIMDRTSLSKIENGRAVPTKQNLDLLLDRLGYNPNDLPFYLLDAETERFQKLTEELDGYLATHKNEEAKTLIRQLEKDKKFAKNSVCQHYLLCTKAAYAMNIDQSWDACFQLVMKAINYGKPGFHEKYIPDYLLSAYDLRAITMLGMLYSLNGENEKAIQILEDVIDNFERNCSSQSEIARHLPFLIQALVSILITDKKYSNAISMSERGLSICRSSNNFFFAPVLTLMKGEALFFLGQEDLGVSLLKEAYFTFKLFGIPSQVKYTEDMVMKKTGISFEELD